MTTAEAYLLFACFVLVAALVVVTALWRSDSRDADRLAAKLRHLQERLAGYRTDVARLSADTARLRRRIEEQRDQLDVAAGRHTEASAIEHLLADLDALPTTDEVEYPR